MGVTTVARGSATTLVASNRPPIPTAAMEGGGAVRYRRRPVRMESRMDGSRMREVPGDPPPSLTPSFGLCGHPHGDGGGPRVSPWRQAQAQSGPIGSAKLTADWAEGGRGTPPPWAPPLRRPRRAPGTPREGNPPGDERGTGRSRGRTGGRRDRTQNGWGRRGSQVKATPRERNFDTCGPLCRDPLA